MIYNIWSSASVFERTNAPHSDLHIELRHTRLASDRGVHVGLSENHDAICGR